jgi:hypothetical protein
MILGVVKAAADAAISASEAAVAPLTGELLATFNTVILPKLDVPSFLVPLITGAEGKVSAPLNAFAKAELELLRLRIDALL